MTDTAPAPPLVGDRVRMYELMVLIRACDERIRRGLAGGEFATTYWPATGQEAIAAALGTVLRMEDQLVSTYRGLHDQIAKGVPLGPLVAEILTRETGVNAGKGGAMHISYPTGGLVLSTGIVGSGLPIATGVGMALQLKGSEHVVVASFGDGATGTGSFHEAVNLAALWRLPVVLLCQNNRYAEMTPTAEAQPVEAVADRAAAYGIGAVTVDGNDPDSVHGALSDAVERARAGGGPTLRRVHDLPFVRPLLRRPDALHPGGGARSGTAGGADRTLPERAPGRGCAERGDRRGDRTPGARRGGGRVHRGARRRPAERARREGGRVRGGVERGVGGRWGHR